MKSIRLAVISDLHCKHSSADKEKERSTNIWTDEITITDNRHPVKALKKLIKESGLIVDILLCPGDIADKSDNQGLISGWNYLKELKTLFQAKELLATIGNHDVNSRTMGTEPAFEILKQLDVENFPVPKEIAISFWANGFTVYENEYCAILIFNSCLTHTNKENAQQSNISDLTLQEIDRVLSNMSNKQFKIAMCHHHPILHANMDYKDTDFIEKGDQFVKVLGKHQFQLVIHGHKHDPRITSVDNLSVFCAGSFASRQNLIDTGADNVFHIVELNAVESKGTITTWLYLPNDGWRAKGKYFPEKTGFGFVGSLDQLAEKCANWFQAKGKQIIEFQALLEEFDEIKYLKPDDQIYFHAKMLETYSIEFVPELKSCPKHICLQQK